MTKKLLCILACTIFLISGCGGDKAESDRAGQGTQILGHPFLGKALEPCELITITDAQSLVGEPVNEGKLDEQPAVGMKKCLYDSINTDSGKFLQITVLQPATMPDTVRKTGQTPKSIFAETKKMLADGRVDLASLGDEAFISTGSLHLLVSEYYITIGTGNTDQDATRVQLEAAARLVLRKLAR